MIKLNKILLILLVGIAVSSSLGAFAYSSFLNSNNKRFELESKHKQLQENYEILNSSYGTLATEYQTLNTTYLGLNETYLDLSANFTALHENYVSLSNSYNGLNTNYAEIRGKYDSLDQTYAETKNKYSSLNQTYAEIKSKYDAFNQTYYTLFNNYETLNQSYLTLQTQYSFLNILCSQLTANYTALNTTYNILNQKYNDLEKLINQPLDYVLVPTWDEVEQWLTLDKTDEIAYNSSSFLCGDFSIMLIQHAKEQHWRMLLAIIEFDYYSENPTGTQNHHGNNAHAFVSIFTTEGIVYIEPQTDYTWYLYNPGDPQTHVEFTDWEFVDFGQEWFGNIFVQYYNRMGANVESIGQGSGSIEVGLPH